MIYHLFLWFWSGLVRLSAPFLIAKRSKKNLEHPERYRERYGVTNRIRPNKPIIWLHGASVGESLTLLPLIEKMTKVHPDWHFLVTTTTVTAQKIMNARLPANATHQFIPFDAIPWVTRFLDHWRPKAIFFVESEIWPNMVKQARARGIPLILLNARLSDTSFRNWQRIHKICPKLWTAFKKIYAQSDEFTKRFQILGAKNASTLGNIKLLAKPLPFDEGEFTFWKNQIADRPCWVVASTHKGEEEQIFKVHLRLKKTFPNLLTIVVPRHIDRCPEILSKDHGVSIATFSGSNLHNEDILLVDAMAKLGVFYRLSPIAFIGGSLIPQGGHNPLEPAMLGAFPIWGPYFQNVNDMMYLFEGFDCQKYNIAELTQSLEDFLAYPEKTRQLAKDLQQRILAEKQIINRKVGEILENL